VSSNSRLSNHYWKMTNIPVLASGYSITTSRVGDKIDPPPLFIKFPLEFFVQFVFSNTIAII
jgi:hypothetical protein